MPKMKIKKGMTRRSSLESDRRARRVFRVYPEKNKVVVEGVAIAKAPCQAKRSDPGRAASLGRGSAIDFQCWRASLVNP